MMLVAGDGVRSMNIWRIPLWEGAPTRVTFDLSSYRIVDLPSDGDRLVTVPARPSSGFWVQRPDAPSPVRVSAESEAGVTGFEFTPDGRLVFAVGNRLEILEAGAQTSRILVEEQGTVVRPAVVSGGRVRYTTMPTEGWGNLVVHEISLDGSERVDLATLPPSTDHRRISYGPQAVYSSMSTGKVIHRTPYDGGAPEKLEAAEGYLPAVSPTGDRLAFYRAARAEGGAQGGITILGLDGQGRVDASVPAIHLEGQSQTFFGSLLRWSEDGEALLVNTRVGDRGTLWRLPLDGSSPAAVSRTVEDLMLWWDAAPDGSVAFARGRYVRDAVLIEGLR